ncbi:MAG: MerR family transcriptional regulator [Desulfovibrio sp.]
MLTVGRLARRFGLSRSTLLYYDRIGLLRPAARGDGEYRTYGPEEVERLERICRYREAGLALQAIRVVLDAPPSSLGTALSARLDAIGQEIARLREQQSLVAGLLSGSPAGLTRVAELDRDALVALFTSAGFEDEDLRRWHGLFERTEPEKHQRLLEKLGVPAHEIALTRAWARGDLPGRGPGQES